MRKYLWVVSVLVALLTPGAGRAGPDQGEAVDVALVMAVDVSLSVDQERYQLQKRGISEALQAPEVLAAIVGGPRHAIALTVVEFSDPDQIAIVVPWTRIAGPEDAERAAARVLAQRRSSEGLTGIGSALAAARGLLRNLPFRAERRVVDLSSDGFSNIGPDVAEMRDALVADGTTVNGLPILSEFPWLAEYFEQNVIGGAGAFVEAAKSPQNFAEAMTRKLAHELILSAASAPRRAG